MTTDAPMERPALRRLADHLGILPEYVDQTGRAVRPTSDLTRVRLLAAMGFDARTEESARATLRTLRRARRRQWIAPVRVVRQRSRTLGQVAVRVPRCAAEMVHWTLVLETEDGTRTSATGEVAGGPNRRLRLMLPGSPPLGYHTLTLTWRASGREWQAHQRLIVVPSACTAPETRLQGRRGFGITTNLYTVRSAKNWGAGDVGDVAELARWLGDQDGAFIGMNPLHALRNAGHDISPYSPITRLFRNPLYLRVDAIPELAFDEAARRLIASPELQEALARARAATTLDYEQLMALRAPVLESLHRTFVERARRAGSPRARAYAAYVAREDPQLTRFATYMAISEREGPDARHWPPPLRDAQSPAVAALRDASAERVDYHRWLQFELDRQLGEAAGAAAASGLALGLYQDLAVGSAVSGSDVWSHPELFSSEATVGAPPDMYSEEGQNWGLPAINPHVLRASGYEYWIRLLRAGFRHAGALRIDHALGLFRVFWVPVGESARQGAYVKAFTEELFGILALESVRHGALVVGEDLGTVPPEVPGVLARWGVLGSKVLVFERDFHTGRYRDAGHYPRLALATVNTHDLPPLVGWLEERDIQIRTEVGDLADPALAEQMRRVRRAEREALIASLREAGVLGEGAADQPSAPAASAAALIAAVHSFIRRTPSALVGLSLDDIAHEAVPVNIPGVWQDRYPSWTRRMRHTLEEIIGDERAVAALGSAGRAVRASP